MLATASLVIAIVASAATVIGYVVLSRRGDHGDGIPASALATDLTMLAIAALVAASGLFRSPVPGLVMLGTAAGLSVAARVSRTRTR